MAHDDIPPLPKSSSGLNGCLIGCLIFFAVAVAGAGLVGYAMYRGATGMLNAATETAPRELPPLTLSEEEKLASEEKLAQLSSAFESGGDSKEFTLSGEDINVMLRAKENTRLFGESVYVTVANGEIRGEVSFPLGELIPLLDGRYLNGSATFNVSASDGRLFVFIESFQVKGEDAPPEVMAQLRVQNLAQDMANDPSIRDFVAKIEAIRVEEDRVIVTLK